MHAERRDIDCSVSLSVCRSVPVLCLNESTLSSQLLTVWPEVSLQYCFLSPTAVAKFRTKPLPGGVQYTEWEKLRLSTEIAVYIGNGILWINR